MCPRERTDYPRRLSAVATECRTPIHRRSASTASTGWADDRIGVSRGSADKRESAIAARITVGVVDCLSSTGSAPRSNHDIQRRRAEDRNQISTVEPALAERSRGPAVSAGSGTESHATPTAATATRATDDLDEIEPCGHDDECRGYDVIGPYSRRLTRVGRGDVVLVRGQIGRCRGVDWSGGPGGPRRALNAFNALRPGGPSRTCRS